MRLRRRHLDGWRQNLGARDSNPIRASLGESHKAGGASSPTQGEIPRLLFGFERGKLRPFFLLYKNGILAVVSPFQERVFFVFFTEERRHALSFLGKGADEVLLLRLG